MKNSKPPGLGFLCRSPPLGSRAQRVIRDFQICHLVSRQGKKNSSWLPTPTAILEKYEGSPYLINGKVLPVLTNQKMNAYLKEIAHLSGVKKTLTTHLALHTFATTLTLSNGVSIESVSEMLGHKNLKITQHYAKILNRKVSEDMQLLREKLQTKKEHSRSK
jgi:site-specific recombinase XerD